MSAASPLPVGAEAPDFALAPAPGPDLVRLSDFRGQPVVLLFFPLAFSPFCTDEICAAVEDFSIWSELGAQVLGISVDQVFVLQKFSAETGAAFPLLSDFNREAMTAYGVRNDDFFGARGVAHRSAFVVDRRGRVAYSWMSEDASVQPDFAAIQGVVRSLG